MHVYQPVDLVLGLLAFLLGFVGIMLDLRRVFAGTFKNSYSDWRSLGLGIWFLSGGPAHFSRAFDLRHHESHTTLVLEIIETTVVSVILVASVIAWIIRRRHAIEADVTKATHLAA